jgi:cytochrome c nitrite reductase small subunit
MRPSGLGSRKTLVFVALLAGLTVGVTAGLGAFTFVYAKGGSYLTNDPEACANCHVMREQYDAWTRSSHHHVAVCNDCHTPHDFFGKYQTKTLNGYHHSLAFTLQNFHEPIEITERNRAITEEACRHCHSDIVQSIDHLGRLGSRLSCIRCHSSVGHLE